MTAQNPGQGGDRAMYAPGRAERNGVFFGLTGPQAVLCGATVVPLLLIFGAGARALAVELAPGAALLIALVVLPIRGRPAARWLGDVSLHGIGLLTGWSSFQSRAAAGLPVLGHGPDQPGGLARLDPIEGPVMPEVGRVCVLHDTAERRWGATARLTARGIGLASAHECHAMADGLRQMLRGLVDSERIDRVTLLVRSVPDDGTAYELWRAQHTVPDAPDLVRAATAELRATAGAVAVRQESFLTVSAPDDALRREARDAGGGPIGHARALYRGLGALTDPLQAMGCDPPEWLGPDALSEVVRTGFNPGAAGTLAQHRLTHPGPDEHSGDGGSGPSSAGSAGSAGWPWELAGPSRAPSPAARSYTHDGYTTVSYTAVPTGAGIRFGSIGPLLAIRRAGVRRCVAIHFEVVPQRVATRMATRGRQSAALLGDVKADRGITRSAADARAGTAAYRTEDAIAAGEGLVRVAVTVSVTVPSHWNVEDHAQALEAAAPGQYHLQRLELAQDSGFVASTLPVGLGLPRLRTRL